MCDKKVKASDFFVPDPLYDEFKECQERNEKISNMAKNLKNLTKGIDKKIDLYSFCDVTEEEVTAYNSDQMEELE